MSESPKWEYAVVTLGYIDASEASLNQFGTDGWELVSAVQQPAGDFVGFMKRQLPPPKKPPTKVGAIT